MRVGLVRSRTSDVKLTAAVSILDGDTERATTSSTDQRDVEAVNIDLIALTGSIGTEDDFLETNLSDTLGAVAQTGSSTPTRRSAPTSRRRPATCASASSRRARRAARARPTRAVRHATARSSPARGAAANVIAVRIDLSAEERQRRSTRRTTSTSTRRLFGVRPVVRTRLRRGRQEHPASPRPTTSSACSRRRRLDGLRSAHRPGLEHRARPPFLDPRHRAERRASAARPAMVNAGTASWPKARRSARPRLRAAGAQRHLGEARHLPLGRRRRRRPGRHRDRRRRHDLHPRRREPRGGRAGRERPGSARRRPTRHRRRHPAARR